MNTYTITFQPQAVSVTVPEGTTLLQAQRLAGLQPDAPCGGNGKCGKCKLIWEQQEILACQTKVHQDMTVYAHSARPLQILANTTSVSGESDGTHRHVLAFDVGTTTVVAYLLDGMTGELKASASTINPQSQYGADVISRIQFVLNGGGAQMQDVIWTALEDLTRKAAKAAGISPGEITQAALVGNTAMHHLLLGIDPTDLVTPPYMPKVSKAMEIDGRPRLSISGSIRILPNIAGFVGGDTVGCMVYTRFDRLKPLTLLIDIGTNGEMVLGNQKRRVCCSTAAGPAFEGANISCGMRGAPGAVDHVTWDGEKISYHVIGGQAPAGLCGSGLLDLVAALLDAGILDESGRLENKAYTLCPGVVLTQKDVREVQLAKAAIRTGIELLAQRLSVRLEQIETVYLAGAFGNYLNPASACRIGMIPPVLQKKISPIGNAAGEGAKLCAFSGKEFSYSQQLASSTEFLELANTPQFQDRYVDALEFSEETL